MVIRYGVETSKKTYVNYKVVKEVRYRTERIAVKNEAEILAEFVKARKNNAIGFHIIDKNDKIAFIEVDYTINEEKL